MRYATTVIIGAGQAGLAMSRRLSERSIDHVLIERGEVANSWRNERWDSLRLLTPNWQSRLPGYSYKGDDRDGYMTAAETASYLSGYADFCGAPVETHTEVLSVRPDGCGYRVATTSGDWRCVNVVMAAGACRIPTRPRCAEGMPKEILQFSPLDYKRPDQLPDGGVLIVGGGATGVQLAREIQLSGRQVTLSVGEHLRAPRIYRGKDIELWSDFAGLLDERYDEVDDIDRARRTPSPQIVGSDTGVLVDINALKALGVEVVGRFAGVQDGRARFSGGLANLCALADLKMNRMLDAIDEWITEAGLDSDVPAPHRPDPTRVPDAPRLETDLTGGAIKSVIWATGYRPDYSWLHVPVFDRRGRLRYDGGVVDAAGLYVMGLPFMRRRKSLQIDGVGADARDLADHMAARLHRAAA